MPLLKIIMVTRRELLFNYGSSLRFHFWDPASIMTIEGDTRPRSSLASNNGVGSFLQNKYCQREREKTAKIDQS